MKTWVSSPLPSYSNHIVSVIDRLDIFGYELRIVAVLGKFDYELFMVAVGAPVD
jgi:hypothetical protein